MTPSACAALAPSSPFGCRCTLPVGHPGAHACRIDGRTWSDDEAAEAQR